MNYFSIRMLRCHYEGPVPCPVTSWERCLGPCRPIGSLRIIGLREVWSLAELASSDTIPATRKIGWHMPEI